MSSEHISGLMWIPTLYGWNPAPVDRYFIPLFTGCYTSQVVQDFLPSTIAFSWSKDHLASPLENWANAVSSHPSIKSPHPARPSLFDAREKVSTTLVIMRHVYCILCETCLAFSFKTFNASMWGTWEYLLEIAVFLFFSLTRPTQWMVVKTLPYSIYSFDN